MVSKIVRHTTSAPSQTSRLLAGVVTSTEREVDEVERASSIDRVPAGLAQAVLLLELLTSVVLQAYSISNIHAKKHFRIFNSPGRPRVR